MPPKKKEPEKPSIEEREKEIMTEAYKKGLYIDIKAVEKSRVAQNVTTKKKKKTTKRKRKKSS